MKTCILAAMAWATMGLTLSAATISLVPSNATPSLGSTFTIDLVVTGNTDEILGFGLDTSLSTSAIVLQSSAINPFFGPDLGLQPDTQLSAIVFPGNTSSTVTLVTFSFLANSAGSSLFQVISDPNDLNEGLFTLASATGSDLSTGVTINVQNAQVPEPATFGLVALAAAGILIARRR